MPLEVWMVIKVSVSIPYLGMMERGKDSKFGCKIECEL